MIGEVGAGEGGELEFVSHSGFLGFEVSAVVFTGRDDDGDFFDDGEAVAFDAIDLLRIVGHDTDLLEAEVSQDLRADAVVTFVGRQTEDFVGLDGVEAFFLEGVGVEFIGQADASAFLSEVDEDAFSGGVDGFHGVFELGAAVTASGAEDIAGEAFAMDADEDGIVMDDGISGGIAISDAAFAEGEVRLRVDGTLVGEEFEVAPFGGEVNLFDAFDELFAFEAVADQIGDGAHFEAVLLAEDFEFGSSGHFAVFAHDFADDGGGFEAGDSAEIHAALGLTGADECSAVSGAEGVDVSRAKEVVGLGVVGDGNLDGGGTVFGADAGGDTKAFGGIDGDGEGGSELGGVVFGLAMESEAIALFGGERKADESSAMGDHKVDGFGGDELSSVDEVALVLAVLIINQDNGSPRFQLFDGLWNTHERH